MCLFLCVCVCVFPAAVLQATRRWQKSSGWTGTLCWWSRSRSSWPGWTAGGRGSEVKGTNINIQHVFSSFSCLLFILVFVTRQGFTAGPPEARLSGRRGPDCSSGVCDTLFSLCNIFSYFAVKMSVKKLLFLWGNIPNTFLEYFLWKMLVRRVLFWMLFCAEMFPLCSSGTWPSCRSSIALASESLERFVCQTVN